MDDVTAAGILINSLDLTSLNENDTPDTVKDLCFRAVTPYGKTAAVCIYPKFIPLVLQNLPENIRPFAIVPLGYPAETPKQPDDRYHPEKIHWGKW